MNTRECIEIEKPIGNQLTCVYAHDSLGLIIATRKFWEAIEPLLDFFEPFDGGVTSVSVAGCRIALDVTELGVVTVVNKDDDKASELVSIQLTGPYTDLNKLLGELKSCRECLEGGDKQTARGFRLEIE